MWANEQWANFAIGESSLVLQHNQASIHSLTVYKRCAFQISGLKSESDLYQKVQYHLDPLGGSLPKAQALFQFSVKQLQFISNSPQYIYLIL